MTIEVRPLGNDDSSWERLAHVDSLSFYEDSRERTPHNDGGVVEFDRSVLAYDGQEPVGCSSIYSLNLSVPGTSVPTAGVTWVGTVPTRRRRGVMTALMRSLHDSVHARAEEPLLALWASQGVLYQRFGYGVASHSYLATIPHRLSLAHAPVGRLRVDQVDAADDRDQTLAVYDAVRAVRPGMPELTPPWHERNLADPDDSRDGGSRLRTYLASDASGPKGYVRLRYKHDWSQGYGDGLITVNEMVCASPEAAATLYQLLLDTDVMTRTKVWNLAVDDPILTWLDDPKQVQLGRRDQLYVRLTTIDALARRGYSAPLDVVLEVHDAFHPWNEGRWRLQADTDGSSCERTDASPDVELDVSVLGATYLGSSRWGTLALAGQVAELRAGSVAALDAAFGWPVAAWCPFVF
jgi:predicted acetyltransferase